MNTQTTLYDIHSKNDFEKIYFSSKCNTPGELLWQNVFTFWNPDKSKVPKQGWKIHISCFFNNYQEILDIVTEYCFKHQISFKYVNNKKILLYLLSKNANRSESGKFITIYPECDQTFAKVVRELYQKLKYFEGPYILSDKRYLDAKVIYYRYGSNTEDNAMVFKEGQLKDERLPYYREIPYVNDPLTENTVEDNVETYLEKNYNDIKPIVFSNAGGIYEATYNKKQSVILKKARPFIGISEANTVYLMLVTPQV